MKYEEALVISETALGRFIDKHTKNGYAVVSACRGELSSAENKKRTEALKAFLSASKFSFKPVKGGFIENLGTKNQKEVFESSFMIYAYDKEGEEIEGKELLDFAKRICKQYNQDSVLYSKDGSKPVYMDRNGKEVFSPGSKLKINDKNQEYFSEFKKNQRFTMSN